MYYIVFGLAFLLTTIPTSQSLWQVDFALSAYDSLLSSSQTQAPSAICTRAGNGLSADQKSECILQPDAALAIAEGTLHGLQECSRQLSSRRWNCSYENRDIFKHGLHKNTKETAYVQAITSAGIVYSIARACSRDQIAQCSCDNTGRSPPEDREFQWGGCGDNLAHGYNYAIKFSAHASANKDVSSLLNDHNSEAGRLAVTEKYGKECYCHGISGSCSIKTCWVVTPTLKHIGHALTKKYASAMQVTVSPSESNPILHSGSTVSNKELVYTRNSPTYCERDEKHGSIGTKGRECNRTPGSVKNCNVMCCNRGFQRKIVTFTEECNCKFVWCCELKCQKCTHVEERYYCR